MCKELMIETLKALAYAALLCVILVGVAVLAGCASYDGDGFYNSGKPERPACVEKDSRGNERWFSC